MDKWIDLHAHTTCSDGSLTPSEMVELAAKSGLAAVAITDHDSVTGIDEALDAGRRFGIRVVPGLELSTKHKNRSVHLVGLFPDTRSEALQKMMQDIVDARKTRNRKMFERLAELNYPVDPSACGAGDDTVVTRGLVGQLLVEAGYFKTVQETFDVLLNRGKPAYLPKWSPEAADGIRLLHEAGATVFIAHYHKIYKNDLQASRQAAEELLLAGADGLEVRYSDFTEAEQCVAEELAEQYRCLRSGGSDFHGKIKPGLALGSGYGSLRVPYVFLEKIDEFRREKAEI